MTPLPLRLASESGTKPLANFRNAETRLTATEAKAASTCSLHAQTAQQKIGTLRDALSPARDRVKREGPSPTASENSSRVSAQYIYGSHVADRICPRGQKQMPCACETCRYWRERYPKIEGS